MYLDGLVPESGFVITTDLIREFNRRNIANSGGGGQLRTGSNKSFSLKLAALTLVKYKKSVGCPIKEGFLYVISNPAWPDTYKIGRSTDPKARLLSYQTYSPHRDYKLEHWSFWQDIIDAESKMLGVLRTTETHEWIYMPSSELGKLTTLLSTNSFIGKNKCDMV